MMVVFSNKRGTEKFAFKMQSKSILNMKQQEIDKITETINLNKDYGWFPASEEYVQIRKLPVINIL